MAGGSWFTVICVPDRHSWSATGASWSESGRVDRLSSEVKPVMGELMSAYAEAGRSAAETDAGHVVEFSGRSAVGGGGLCGTCRLCAVAASQHCNRPRRRSPRFRGPASIGGGVAGTRRGRVLGLVAGSTGR